MTDLLKVTREYMKGESRFKPRQSNLTAIDLMTSKPPVSPLWPPRLCVSHQAEVCSFFNLCSWSSHMKAFEKL